MGGRKARRLYCIKKVFAASLIAVIVGCGGDSRQLSEDRVLVTGSLAGVSWLSALNGRCEWLDIFSDVPIPVLSILWGSFGESPHCVMQWLREPRFKVLNVYLGNSVCVRKNNCAAEDTITAAGRLANALKIARLAHEGGEWAELRITLSLEDNFGTEEACTEASEIRSALLEAGYHSVEVWRNPERASEHDFSSDCFDGIELHNDQRFPIDYAGACAYSNDGADLEIGNTIWDLPNRTTRQRLIEVLRGSFSGCTSYIWTADGNCLSTDSLRAVHPSARNCIYSESTGRELREMIIKVQGGGYGTF